MGANCLKLTAVPALFATAAIYFLLAFVMPMFTETSDASNINVQIGEALMVLALTVFVALPLIIFAMSFASALVSALVADFMVGNVPNPDESRSKALGSMMKIFFFGVREALLGSGGFILGTLLLMGSALMPDSGDSGGFVAALGILGIVAGCIAMPIVYGYESLAVPAILVEKLGVAAAARRSRALMKQVSRQPGGLQYVFNAYGMLFLMMVFVGIGIGMTFGMAAVFESGADLLAVVERNEIANQLLTILPVFLTVWFLIPIWATMTTILYFERRVRLEGYDIETLARDVGRAHKSNRFEL